MTWLGKDVEAAERRVDEAKTESFAELVKIAGLDPKQHLRFADWSGVDFSGCDLRGCDFTGARIRNCKFDGAFIKGARFDQAEINGTDLRVTADWVDHLKNWVSRGIRVIPRGGGTSRITKFERTVPIPGSSDAHLPAGAVFQDAPFGPEMVVLPPGRFWMGSRDGEGDDDERLRHEVTMPHAIAVGRYPVTFEEWEFAMTDEEWLRVTVPSKLKDEGWGRARKPVIHVSWEEAQHYVTWLFRKTGQRYRLLSEAEWEYACRAGSEAAYCFGDDEAKLGDYAWYAENSEGRTHLVGEKMPNKFGLYDMHGNVWEWCEDVLHESYEDKPGETTMDPVLFHAPFGKGVFNEALELEANGGAWITGDSSRRVLRGGSWYNIPSSCRSAYGSLYPADVRSNKCGLRVARTLSF